MPQNNALDSLSRRHFVRAASASMAVGALPGSAFGIQRGTRADTINIGLIGCGGRGTGAAINALGAGEDIRIVAMADLFEDRLASSRGHLQSQGGDRATIDSAQCYVGFDAFERLLAHADVDLVILATPPHFRPQHLDAAIEAGKHVFMEKPVAVDPVGARMVMDAARRAKASKLSIVAGTQRRHEQSYLEAMQQIEGGAIGEVTHARVYWNQDGI